MTEPITSFKLQYAFLSNFYVAPIVAYDDVLKREIRYQTVEHAFQADKTLSVEERLTVIDSETPRLAKAAGRCVTMRSDWELIKVERMRYWVKLKFAQYPVLKARLVATGDAELIEGNHWGDKFWGVCDGEGQNWLGRILMQVRP
jgi:ribA/ribD-fused uncharacterized protein